MLGRLARWLRLLGWDTVYDSALDDALLARRAEEEQRILLTRDRRLLAERGVSRAMLVEQETLEQQLRQVLVGLGLRRKVSLFTRCSRCNAALATVDKQHLGPEVPERVLRRHDRFARCLGCARVYWRGSHVRRMERALARILAEAVPEDGGTSVNQLP